MNKLPIVRIKYSRFLDPIFKKNFESKQISQEYPEPDQIIEKVKFFNNVWKSNEKIILPSICEVLGLEFKQNIVDVYIVGRAKPFSDPLVISSHFDSADFIDNLTHELLHRLISDNTKNIVANIGAKWDQIYEGEEKLTLNHILVHAVCEYIYLDVLKEPERLKRDIELCSKNPPYARSWEIVKKKGYKQIIAEFLELSANLPSTN